ncbi:hypothetical protein IJT17_10440, partial [bacterium]|nr:hypothetical protein [bacterium]
MFTVGSTVIHPIHGLGTVQNISEQVIMGQCGSFATIYFDLDKITINVRAEGEGTMIRPLIAASEIPTVIKHMKTGSSDLPSGASERYSVSMKKYKSNNIILMAETVRD